ncbi:hypothetical protein D3C80_1876870 [compost metagenome]
MADAQLPGPLTHFSGWVPGNQHKVTLPVLADGIEHLKAFHIGQAVIEHHHIRCKSFGFADRLRTVVRYQDFQPLRRQILLEVLCKQLFVFNNQYSVQQGRLLVTTGTISVPREYVP